MKQHAFIPVFFNAPLGGLQSHVTAQVKGLLNRDWSVTVMCKPGQFASHIEAIGAQVLESDFSDINTAGQAAISAGPYSVVHAHPFAGRKVGLEVSEHFRIPLFVTMHGGYTDNIETWVGGAFSVIAVSEAIRDHLVFEQHIAPSKITVIPNAVDSDTYNETRRNSTSPENSVTREVLIVSRYDKDKQFIVDAIAECLDQSCMASAHTLNWLIAGTGSEIEKIERSADRVRSKHGPQSVRFLGWLNDSQLASLYGNAHLTVGSGRCALDAMACGCPAIAIGSKAYVGLLSGGNLRQGIYNNFGGIDPSRPEYLPGQLYRDIDSVIYDQQSLAQISQENLAVCNAYYQQESADRKLSALYEMALSSARSSTDAHTGADTQFTRLTDETLWRDRGMNECVSWSVDQAGVIQGAADMGDDQSIYLTTGSQVFGKPALNSQLVLQAHGPITVSLPVTQLDEALNLSLFIAEYDSAERLNQKQYSMQAGTNEIHFRPDDRSESIRLFLRFSGKGQFRINPVGISFKSEQDPVYGKKYLGENLIFILGAPRSGTSWLLGVIGAHPDVHQASEQDFGLESNNRTSLETNIFNPNRQLSDDQIRWLFQHLSSNHSGTIVEKTPLHLLHAERIRRLFPNCKLVLTIRDGRDVINSMIQVGRNPDSWWRSAPATMAGAVQLWTKYAEASLRCIQDMVPLIVRYEAAIDEPEVVFNKLFHDLNLDQKHTRDCILQSEGGKHIPIPGVFRTGSKGSWKKELSAAEIEEMVDSTTPLLQQLGYSPGMESTE